MTKQELWYKRLFLVVLFLMPAAVSAQQTTPTVLVPVTGTQQMKTQPMILVAPNIYALPDLTKYQPAFDACMKTGTANQAICMIAGNTAAGDEAKARFYAAMLALYAGVQPGQTPDALLASYKLFIVVQ